MLLEIGLILAALVAYWYYRYHHLTKDLKGITIPKPWPLIGNGLEFTGESTVFLDKPYEFSKKFGDFGVMIGFILIVFIEDYEMLEFFLSSNKLIDKAHPYTFLHNWLGTGLLTSTGEKWKKRRRIITPAYHFQILEQFTEVFDNNCNTLIKKLEKEVSKGSTDIYPYITLCALDNICESAMGTSVNAQQCENSDYVLSVKEMCRIITERAFSALKTHNFFYKCTKDYWKERKALKILHDYTTSVIVSRRNALLDENKEEGSQGEFGQKKRVAFLDLLLKSTMDGKPLSNDDIREEVDTFMFEGHDTTASAMAFALFCIANDQRVQEKIMQEQKEIFENDPDRVPLHRDLQEMKYLEMAIKETLRLYPSVPFYARELKEDCKFSDDVIFKKGTQISIFAYGVQRNEQYFPDAEKFLPERFESTSGQNPYAFIPFSAGPRNCIGQKFAMLEMKAVISKVVRKYELHPVIPEHKLKLVPETILKSANGVLINIKKRSW